MKTLLLLLSCFVATAADTMTFTWNRNPETNIIAYRLYYGIQARAHSGNVYTKDVTVMAPQMTATATNLQPGVTYYFALTAIAEGGHESDYSDELSYAVPTLPPTQTQNLRGRKKE